MNNWKSILKNTKQISQTGIKTKLGTKPLTISDNDDEDCCENAVQRFSRLEDDIFNFWHDLGTIDLDIEQKYSSSAIQTFLNTDMHPNIIFIGANDQMCDEFYQFLTLFWGRIGKALIYLPTTTQDLWKRGHEIKNEIHEIMKEWEECDDYLMGRGADPKWTELRGKQKEYGQQLRDSQMEGKK